MLDFGLLRDLTQRIRTENQKSTSDNLSHLRSTEYAEHYWFVTCRQPKQRSTQANGTTKHANPDAYQVPFV